jgi:hypothetical protein
VFDTAHNLDAQGQPKNLRFSKLAGDPETVTIKVANGDWVRGVYQVNSAERTATVYWFDLPTTPTRTHPPVPTPTQGAYNRVYLSVEPLGPARQQFPADAGGVYRGGVTINFYFSSSKPVEVLIQTRDRSGNPIQDHYLPGYLGPAWQWFTWQPTLGIPAQGSRYDTIMSVRDSASEPWQTVGTWGWAVGSQVRFDRLTYQGTAQPATVIVTDTIADARDMTSVVVDVVSRSEPSPGQFILNQVSPRGAGVYTGAVPFCFGCPVSDPALKVGDGDTITVTYKLAGEGDGRVQATAVWLAPPTPTLSPAAQLLIDQ